MSNESNNHILKNISKELLTGLFPYVFANKEPTIINKDYIYKVKYSSGIDNSKLVATKTKKKIIYKPHNIDWKNICLINYSNNFNYAPAVYFKKKNYLKLDERNVRRRNNSVVKKLTGNVLGIKRIRRVESNNIINKNNNEDLYANYRDYTTYSSNISSKKDSRLYRRNSNNYYKSKLYNNTKFY